MRYDEIDIVLGSTKHPFKKLYWVHQRCRCSTSPHWSLCSAFGNIVNMSCKRDCLGIFEHIPDVSQICEFLNTHNLEMHLCYPFSSYVCYIIAIPTSIFKRFPEVARCPNVLLEAPRHRVNPKFWRSYFLLTLWLAFCTLWSSCSRFCSWRKGSKWACEGTYHHWSEWISRDKWKYHEMPWFITHGIFFLEKSSKRKWYKYSHDLQGHETNLPRLQ